MVISFGALLKLWGEAMLLTFHIQNRISYMKIRKIKPISYKEAINLTYYTTNYGNALQMFLKPSSKRSKMKQKTINCLFIRYVQDSTNYIFLVLFNEGHSFKAYTIIKCKAEF